MRSKQLVRKVAWGVLAIVLMIVAVFTMNVNVGVASASVEDAGVKALFTPTATGENYTVSGFSKWQQTTAVEDYADSPTGKVLHHVVDSDVTAENTESWPSLKMNIPYDGDASDFAGYIIWLEYEAEMYSNDSYWGLFNFRFGGDSHTIGLSKPITFIDADGNIDETITNRYMYHHNNFTEIADSGYTYAYAYSFKGYMIIPKESLAGSEVAPSADRVLQFSHHWKKELVMDLKIGSIGYYTDYNAVLAELGRCSYSFVDYDGTVIQSERVKPGTTVVAPEYDNTFTKDGKVYSLVGWSGYTPNMAINSDKTFKASYKMRDFHMVKGASVRTNADSSGIRYIAEFDENVYNEVSLDPTKQFGMLITKYDYYEEAMASGNDLVAGLNGLGANKYVLITETSANPLAPYECVTETGKMYRINGALTNIQYSHADWQWIGVGMIITTTDEGTEYFCCAYEEQDVVRTMAYVASAALSNPEEDFDAEETAMVKSYVYKAAAKLAGETEEAYNSQADKSAYLADFELAISDGIDASYDFNANDGMKEAYLNIGEAKTISATIQNSFGQTLDVVYGLMVGDESVLSCDGKTLKALKNGYTTLTMNCELFGYTNTIMVYTGSEDAGGRSQSYRGSNVNASYAGAMQGEVDGVEYDWGQYQKADSAHIFAHYSDISVYYIDYLLSQGYKYLRIPFYFDTTRWAELGATSETQVTAPYITTWTAKGYDGSSGGTGYHYKNIPTNEWCYYDMDLYQYRMNYVEADGSGVDGYGMKKAASSYYQYLNLKFCSAYSYVYTGRMSFIKSPEIDITEAKSSVKFGDSVTLRDYYSAKEQLYFTVDGRSMQTMTAISSEHEVIVKANVYTVKIGDGQYTIGDKASWKVTYDTFQALEKTIEVENGLGQLGGTKLIDLNGVAAQTIDLSDYTGASILEENGFTVQQSLVKRYSDQTALASSAVSNAERGIFYATVSATNGVQNVEYNVTLDLYSSGEAVEYESFGHADSEYAVRVHYIIRDTASEGLYDIFEPYETVKNFYVTGTKNADGKDLYGMALTSGDYWNLKKYGDDGSKDTDSTNKTALKTGYGYTTDDELAGLSYFALDGSKIQMDGPITKLDGSAWSTYSIDACIYIYVMPRHTQEYYQYYSSADRMKMVYAEPMTSGSVVADFLTGVSGDVNNPKTSKTKKQNYSANWQASLMGTGPQAITVETIATYYDAFATMQFPMASWSRPAGRAGNSLSDKLFKIGMLIF